MSAIFFSRSLHYGRDDSRGRLPRRNKIPRTSVGAKQKWQMNLG
ncbi:MAG: hypothetical protein ACYSSI_03605 [Planctomycetota bacterium]